MRKRALLLAMLTTACGSGTPPTPTPSASPTAAPLADPVIQGRYVLEITPSASCGMPARLSFLADGLTFGGPPRANAQLLLPDMSPLVEGELMAASRTIRGGIGTTGDGALSLENIRVWLHAIADVPVTTSRDGRAEGVGPLAGYIALGGPDDQEGALGICSAPDHSFRVRIP